MKKNSIKERAKKIPIEIKILVEINRRISILKYYIKKSTTRNTVRKCEIKIEELEFLRKFIKKLMK